MAKITLIVDANGNRTLEDRAQRMSGRDDDWKKLNPLVKSLQFLRGVQSRAGMALPAFYLFCGARDHADTNQNLIIDYPGAILKDYLEFSSLNTITLACRKAFDHSKKGLTGKNFVKWSNQAMSDLVGYWSSRSGRAPQDTESAIVLLQTIFRDLSQSPDVLLGSDLMLGRRIGLLVQHASRSAAHLSMERYEFDLLDCAHVVSALVLIAEIIRSFDASDAQPNFDSLDRGSLNAARQLFPCMPDLRLFQNVEIETQSRLCWQWGVQRGREMIIQQLPSAIGWY